MFRLDIQAMAGWHATMWGVVHMDDGTCGFRVYVVAWEAPNS